MPRARAAILGGSLALAVLASGALIAEESLQAEPQAPPSPTVAAAAFEVASVKPNTSSSTSRNYSFRPGGLFVVTNNTLRRIVRNAYSLQDFQLVGGPEWLNRDSFDITAKSADPSASIDSIRVMVRTLLADRFKLVVHTESRELPIYAIVLARPDGRLGPKIQASTVDCAALVAAMRSGQMPPPGSPSCGTNASPGRMSASNVTIAEFAGNVSSYAGRHVVDKTGLTGRFNFELEFAVDSAAPSQPGATPSSENAANLFTAVQEQLGLKLEAQRGPVEVVVIDSAAKPEPD